MNAQAAAQPAPLDSVIAALRAAPAADAALLERFARAFLARVPEDELASRPAADSGAVQMSPVAVLATGVWPASSSSSAACSSSGGT